ncbi:MAG: efflux RND transporter periplasmic adaptor subunit [Gammaproteobacteria bacterium]|nr:efflux RND transporter periplasmic adaptor subunit [Gammaproteobacteria bacterium]MCZ6853705.1 efflux RND transporter periplasmic adaptor subunit [Gammaproteobacteria bacterium]
MNNRILITAVVTLILGVGLGYWIGQSSPAVTADGVTPSEAERKPLFYRNPMNPTVTSPVPAKDAMGMDYVPVFDDESNGGEIAGTVRIDSVVQQNIGVRMAKAELTSLSHTVRAVGRISYDEKRITQLHPKIAGWIEELFVNTTGQQVEKDTILLSLYSPRLVASQQEYVLALKNYEVLKSSPIEDIRRGAEELVQSSRARLEFFDVPEHQIRELETTLTPQKALHIHSPAAGIVIRIGAREGQHVSPQTELFMIADLSRVWAYADIFEYELPWIEVGDEAEMTLAGLPGRTFRGRIAYIYPYAESKTRTVKVRIELDNPDLALKPEMFAEITVHASQQDQATVIPSEAVIRSGSRDQVFVVRGPGHFEPRTVELGLQSDGRVIVLDGVLPGEEVVTSAQFLIDSESKLREATAKMTEVGMDGSKSDATSSADMDMDADKPMDMNAEEHADMEADERTMNMNMRKDINISDMPLSSLDESQ